MRSLTTGLLVLFGPGLGLVSLAADFDGDGTGDIAIFRASSGLWAVRGITRVYFGATGDNPVPGDYDGSGTESAAIFRPSGGLWAVRDVTRVYFGSGSDDARPGDYTGDGTYDVGIFRASSGLWAVRGVTRIYYGTSGDVAIAAGKIARSVRPVFTGQSVVYRTGDDGYYQMGGPFRYETRSKFLTDWVVVDHNTGLMWGQAANDEVCNWGRQTDWNSAIDYCDNLEYFGYDDWRLPNVKELQSIVDYGSVSPAINTTYFTIKTGRYWSSTTSHLFYDDAWYVGSSDGIVNYQNKSSQVAYLRAVRGGR